MLLVSFYRYLFRCLVDLIGELKTSVVLSIGNLLIMMEDVVEY